MALLCQLENQLSSIFPLSTIPSDEFLYTLLQAHNKTK